MVLMWKIVVKLRLYIIKSLFVYVTSQDEHTCDFNEDLFAMLDVLTQNYCWKTSTSISI